MLTTLYHGSERWTLSTADMNKLNRAHHRMLAQELNIPSWRRHRLPKAHLRHRMKDIAASEKGGRESEREID